MLILSDSCCQCKRNLQQILIYLNLQGSQVDGTLGRVAEAYTSPPGRIILPSMSGVMEVAHSGFEDVQCEKNVCLGISQIWHTLDFF